MLLDYDVHEGLVFQEKEPCVFVASQHLYAHSTDKRHGLVEHFEYVNAKKQIIWRGKARVEGFTQDLGDGEDDAQEET